MTGEGISNPNFNLSTFKTKVEDGKVFVQVPPCSEMEEKMEKMIQESFKADGREYLAKKTGGPVDHMGQMLVKAKGLVMVIHSLPCADSCDDLMFCILMPCIHGAKSAQIGWRLVW